MKSNSKLVILILAVILVALAIVEAIFARPHHPVFPWHNWPGFMALLGLGASVIVVALIKILGKPLLQRPEEYDD